jgi:hypothetical protein
MLYILSLKYLKRKCVHSGVSIKLSQNQEKLRPITVLLKV